MRRPSPVVFLVLGVMVGTTGGYWYARLPASTSDPTITASSVASAAERKILYYRDPSGAPYWAAGPKKDANGRDYLPVYEDEEISFDPRSKKPPAALDWQTPLTITLPMPQPSRTCVIMGSG
jgi:membrane fusion protein, copper/silver efflux system